MERYQFRGYGEVGAPWIYGITKLLVGWDMVMRFSASSITGGSLGNLEWQDRMIFGWIVGWYPGYKGAVFAYMWNCFGCSFDIL